MLIFSIPTLLAICLLQLSSAQTTPLCSANTKLSNLIQMDKILEVSSAGSTANDEVNLSFVVPYSAANFESRPTAILSIRDYQCPSFASLNYRSLAEVGETAIRVVFTSKGMKWTSVSLVLWVTARPDLYAGSLSAENLKPGSQTPVTVYTKKPMPFYSDGQTLSLNFINSLTASSASTYSINCSAASKTETAYTVSIALSPETSVSYIKVDYLIYNLNLTQFASDGGFFSTSLAPDAPLYIKFHNNFAPILYWFVGIDTLVLGKDKALTFGFDLDKDYVLGVHSGGKIDNIKFIYVGMGQKMVDICGNCSTGYAYGQNCVDRCPDPTYPYEGYLKGGKSCLTCSPKLHQVMNQNKTGCNCMAGFKKSMGNGCEPVEPAKLAAPVTSVPSVPASAIVSTITTTTASIISTATNSTNVLVAPVPVVAPTTAPMTNTNTTTNSSTIKNSTAPVMTMLNNTMTNGSMNTSTVRGNTTVVLSTKNAGDMLDGSITVAPIKNTTITTIITTTTTNTSSRPVAPAPALVPLSAAQLNMTTTVNRSLPRSPVQSVNMSRVSAPSLNVSPMISHSVSEVSTLLASDIALPACAANQKYNSTTNKCECDEFSIPDQSGCFKCSDGSYKDGLACNPCAMFCLTCKTATTCDKCENGYAFDPAAKACMPGAGAGGANDGGFSSFGGGSFDGGFGTSDGGFTSDGSFTSPPTTPATPATTANTSTTTTSTTTTTTTTTTPVPVSPSTTPATPASPTPTPSPSPTAPPSCKQNQVLQDKKCVCNHRSIQFNDECIECPPPMYKDAVTKNCMPCTDVDPHCATCDNATKCLACQDNMKIDATGKCACLPPFHMLQTGCAECPPGFVYDDKQKTCINPALTPTPTPTPATNTTLTPTGTPTINTTSTTTTTTSTTPITTNSTSPAPVPGTPIVTNTTTTTVLINTTTTTTVIAPPKCKQNEVLVNNVCVCDGKSVNFGGSCTPCPESTFKEQEHACRPCWEVIPQCATCQTATKCLTCQENLKVDATGKCACLPPFHMLESGCIECPPGFVYDDKQVTCINPALNPTPTPTPATPTAPPASCKENQVIVNNACVCDNRSVDFNGVCIQCPQSTFKEADHGCRPCSEVIPQCMNCDSATKCTSCQGNLKVDATGKCACLPPFHMLDHGCTECPPGFVFDQKQKTCFNPALTPTPTPTPTPTTNTTPAQPPKCKQNQILVNNSCVCDSRSVEYNDGCTACPPPTFKDAEMNFCMPCSNSDPNCDTCTNATFCLTCTGNFKPQNGKCLATPNATKPANATPTPTPTPTPQSCPVNQILEQNKCVCNNVSINSSGTCQPCGPGTYKFAQVCASCLEHCLECTSFADCTRCADKYTYNGFDRVCEPTCGPGEVLANGQCLCDQFSGRNAQGVCEKCKPATVKVLEKCLNCSANCLECSTPQKCSKCATGIALNLNTFTCCRINEQYNPSIKDCECNPGMKNISGTCGVCPEGLVYVQATKQCVLASTVTPVTPPIPVIPPGPATSCQPNQILVNGKCICQDGYFSSQGNCLPCLANCLKCSNSDSCDTCNSNYTGRACEFCAPGYFLTGGIFSPQHCERDQCGNGATSNKEECDDGNLNPNDGCSPKCLLENGYICRSTACTKVVTKNSESITSSGVFIQYLYPASDVETATNANLVSISVTNGTAPSNIKIVRPVNDNRAVRALLDYCGLLPDQNITVELVSSSKLGNVKYVSEYNLAARAPIARNTVTKSLREDPEILT